MVKRKIKTLDKIVYFVGIAGNIAVVPQIIRAWSGPAPGLAIATWLLFTVFSVIWLVYAIVHKEKPLIAAQIGGLTVNTMVILGWLINNISL